MRSPRQAAFLRAMQNPQFAAKVEASEPASPVVGATQAPRLTSPGGVVQSGGYLGSAKFKAPSMMKIRKMGGGL